jgi:hypothetical protein
MPVRDPWNKPVRPITAATASRPSPNRNRPNRPNRQPNRPRNVGGGGGGGKGGYMSTLLGLIGNQGSAAPAAAPLIDPANAIRDANPFASFSNAASQYGLNTNAKGDQFTDWFNADGWADVQADYKANINRNPYLRTGQGGDMYSFINNQGSALFDQMRMKYRGMTPQQRGINSATGFKAGRWAVY